MATQHEPVDLLLFSIAALAMVLGLAWHIVKHRHAALTPGTREMDVTLLWALALTASSLGAI